jgi:hypothetical protein
MRIERPRWKLLGVSTSLTRRALLIRTGGATVALACFGALPAGAVVDPAALSSTRAATYAAILDAIHADPGYELADRAERAQHFGQLYAASGDHFRAYADAVLDELAEREIHRHHLSAGGLELAEFVYVEPSDTHTILFTV